MSKKNSKKLKPKKTSIPPKQGYTIKQLKLQKWLGLSLAFLAFILYSNTLKHGFAFDDGIVITENRLTQKGFAGISELASSDFFAGAFGNKGDELAGGRYRPLSLMMFAAEAQLFGKEKTDANKQIIKDQEGDVLYDYNTSVGHWINVLLYATACFLLFSLLLKWFEFQTGGMVLAFLTSLLFLVHPVHTEVVANIKSRDEILALILLLGSLVYWHRFLKNSANRTALWLAAVLFFLSMLAKETPFMFIVIFPVILGVVYKKKGSDLRKPALALYVAAGIYLLVRTSMVGLPQSAVSDTGIMDNPFASSDTGEKLATIALICWRYVLLVIAPITLRSDYTFAHVPLVQFSNFEAILGFLTYSALIVWMFVCWKKKKFETLALAIFLFPLSITTNLLFNIGATMGERFLFIPSIGTSLLIVYLLLHYFKVASFADLKAKPLLAAIFILYSGFGLYKSFDRNYDWKDNQTLFAADVLSTPKSAKMQFYQGKTLLNAWQSTSDPARKDSLLRQSKVHYDESVKIYPPFVISLYDLGLVNMYLGDGPSAAETMSNCLSYNNTHGPSQQLMAQIQYRLIKDYNAAAKHMRVAVEQGGMRTGNTLQDLGIYYAAAQKMDSAVYYLEQAVQVEPNNVRAWKNAAAILGQAGQIEKAQAYLKKGEALEKRGN
jgi:tetratricopeptide (TPR) repeat protein